MELHMSQNLVLRDELIRKRILHLALLFAASLFLYQFTQWEDALWIPISVLAITGPFRPGLALHKAQQRVLGTVVGLFISIIVWLVLRYSASLLVFYAIIACYIIAFTVLNEYKYFILMVTIFLCINFSYMHPFTYSEIDLLINRGLCVFTGVLLLVFAEKYLFKNYYSNAISLVEYEEVDKVLDEAINNFLNLCSWDKKVNTTQINNCISPLLVKLDSLIEIKTSANYGFSKQDALKQRIDNEIAKLSQIINIFNTRSFILLNKALPEFYTQTQDVVNQLQEFKQKLL
jgi:hypothetical protein